MRAIALAIARHGPIERCARLSRRAILRRPTPCGRRRVRRRRPDGARRGRPDIRRVGRRRRALPARALAARRRVGDGDGVAGGAVVGVAEA